MSCCSKKKKNLVLELVFVMIYNYCLIFQTIFILEAQRAQAIKDLDKLYECQEQALADPIAFVECLQNKRNLQIPAPQKVHQLPVIDWTKYALSGSSSAFGRRQLTRLSTKVAQDFFRNSMSFFVIK